MDKQNCWEFKKCGREEGGTKVSELGVCPAASEIRADGINGGENGGRICWAIAGTFCGGQAQGTFARKIFSCHKCDFYQSLGVVDGMDFYSLKDILAKFQD